MSRSYKKHPIKWVSGYSSKKEKRLYNRILRHKDKIILKNYNDNIVLQIHKKDGKSQWHWHCDGKMNWFCNKKILIAEDLRDYKIFIRK